jgi:hypothetical protein
LSDDDRLKWIDSYVYVLANRPVSRTRIFTPDNVKYWCGDNMTKDQLYGLVADIVNRIYTVDEVRKDLADYFDGEEYHVEDTTNEC